MKQCNARFLKWIREYTLCEEQPPDPEDPDAPTEYDVSSGGRLVVEYDPETGDSTTTEDTRVDASGSGQSLFMHEERLENENDDAALAATVEGLFSAITEWSLTGFLHERIASRQHSINGFSMRKGQAIVSHAPTATCYLKVWFYLRKVTKLEGQEETVETEVLQQTYEWDPQSSAEGCVEDKEKSVEHSDNLIPNFTISDGDDPVVTYENPIVVDAPPLAPKDGATSEQYYVRHFIDVLKWACVKDYEPDNPPFNENGTLGQRPCPEDKPNGFPVPSVAGCMDDLALNYNPNATCDDGSCEYDDYYYYYYY